MVRNDVVSVASIMVSLRQHFPKHEDGDNWIADLLMLINITSRRTIYPFVKRKKQRVN